MPPALPSLMHQHHQDIQHKKAKQLQHLQQNKRVHQLQH
jgi:hypothetical protein